MSEPQPPAVADVPAEDAGDGPTEELVCDRMPRRWLMAGPFRPRELTHDYLADIGGRAQALPTAGQSLDWKGRSYTFQSVGDDALWQHGHFTGGIQALDLTAALNHQFYSGACFFALLRNDAPRVVRLAALSPGGEHWNTPDRISTIAWLNGRRINESQFVRLEKGDYRFLVQVNMGRCNRGGKIWFAPRLVDVSGELARLTEACRRAKGAWSELQEELTTRFTLRP